MAATRPKQTLLEKRISWFSNHPVFSVIILCAVVIGGISTFTESTGKLLAAFRREQPSKKQAAITCTIRVSNPAIVPRIIERFGEFTLVKTEVVGMRILAEGRVELLPAAKGPNQFIIPSGGFRDFEITMPKLPVYDSILEQGGANLHISIHPTDTMEIALASAIFQRSALKRYFATADLGEAKSGAPK